VDLGKMSFVVKQSNIKGDDTILPTDEIDVEKFEQISVQVQKVEEVKALADAKTVADAKDRVSKNILIYKQIL
jgi:hypothetical protein